MIPPAPRLEDEREVLRALQHDAQVLERALEIRPVCWPHVVVVVVIVGAAAAFTGKGVTPATAWAAITLWILAGAALCATVGGVLDAPRPAEGEPGMAADDPLPSRATAWIARRASPHASTALQALAAAEGGPLRARHAQAYLDQLHQAIRLRSRP